MAKPVSDHQGNGGLRMKARWIRINHSGWRYDCGYRWTRRCAGTDTENFELSLPRSRVTDHANLLNPTMCLIRQDRRIGKFNIRAAHSVKRCKDDKRADRTEVKTWLMKGRVSSKTGEGDWTKAPGLYNGRKHDARGDFLRKTNSPTRLFRY